MADSWDRNVHAKRADGTQIVRYERAGKWYAEKPDGTRRHIKLAEAASEAWAADTEQGGSYHRNHAGGLAIDAAVRKLRAARKSKNTEGTDNA